MKKQIKIAILHHVSAVCHFNEFNEFNEYNE